MYIVQIKYVNKEIPYSSVIVPSSDDLFYLLNELDFAAGVVSFRALLLGGPAVNYSDFGWGKFNKWVLEF